MIDLAELVQRLRSIRLLNIVYPERFKLPTPLVCSLK